MVLDPFYGLYGWEIKVAKFLNRVVLISEAVGLYWIVEKSFATNGFYFLGICWHPLWMIVPGLIAMAIANILLRWVANFLIVLLYGTTDADVIISEHEEKMERKRKKEERRQQKKLLKLEAKKAKQLSQYKVGDTFGKPRTALNPSKIENQDIVYLPFSREDAAKIEEYAKRKS